jgi:hypothetical protein
MPAVAFGRLTQVPEGPLGMLATLRLMAAMIRTPDPGLLDWTAALHAQNVGVSETALARALFDWTRAHFLYTDDADDQRGGVAVPEVIQNPGATYAQMLALPDHRARGDCDDYIVWLGACYYWLGWPVTLQAVALHPDGVHDHVYLRVTVDGRVYGADPIPEAAGVFGWEPPGVVARVEWTV